MLRGKFSKNKFLIYSQHKYLGLKNASVKCPVLNNIAVLIKKYNIHIATGDTPGSNDTMKKH